MKRIICLSLIVAIVMVVATDGCAASPPVPQTPAAVDDILYSQHFTLKKGYRFEWNKERPFLTDGTILVLKVNPDLVYARQMLEPVLYVGNTTAERINRGYQSGHVIAVVPGKIELAKTPIWFGTPELPERVDSNTVLEELALAKAAGIKPFGRNRIDAALALGGERLDVAGRNELRPYFTTLLEAYSSSESDLINAFKVAVE